MDLQNFLENIRCVKECVWKNNYVYNKGQSQTILCPNTSILTSLSETTSGEFSVTFLHIKTQYMLITTFSNLKLIHVPQDLTLYTLLEVDPRITRTEEGYFQQSLIQDLSLLTHDDFSLIEDVHALLFDIY